jgi:hypothetical protein
MVVRPKTLTIVPYLNTSTAARSELPNTVGHDLILSERAPPLIRSKVT